MAVYCKSCFLTLLCISYLIHTYFVVRVKSHIGVEFHRVGLTFDLHVDKHLLAALPRAGVALVAAPVLHFDPPEEQGGIALRDVGVEQARPATEVPVLQSKLILVVVVAVNGDLLLVPVDHHSPSGSEAAGQDAVVRDDTGDIGIW